jgi:DNA gyrase subunit A
MIRIIRKSDGKQDAAGKLVKRFELDAEQVDAILELKLYKLARLEILVIRRRPRRSDRGGAAGRRAQGRTQALGIGERRAGPGEGEVCRRAPDEDRRRGRRREYSRAFIADEDARCPHRQLGEARPEMKV